MAAGEAAQGRWPTARRPSGARRDDLPEGLAELVDAGLHGPDAEQIGETSALLVVHHGELVVEEYPRAGPDGWEQERDRTHPSWSMSKSVLHSLIGLLVGDGLIDLASPVPVPEWADDARRHITWDHLVHMSSGLAWEEYYDAPASDAVEELLGEGRRDVMAHATGKPLVAEPGTAFAVSSGNANILSGCASRVLADHGEDVPGYFRRRLLDPLGMDSARLDLDDRGIWVASSLFHATARDYARYGLFYVRRGTVDGTRLLDEAWVRGATEPDDSVATSSYLARRRRREWGCLWYVHPIRPETFYASGLGGQRLWCAPAQDLVVVRLGTMPPTPYAFRSPVNRWVDAIQSCVAAAGARGGDQPGAASAP